MLQLTNKWFVYGLILSFLLVMAWGGLGCAERPAEPVEVPEEEIEEEIEEEVTEEEEPPVSQTVQLYFANVDADRLIQEDRELEVDGDEEKLGFAMLEELIKGPQDPELVRTIPEEVQVLEVNIENGVAYADFSEEIITRHWGGSTGELLTVYSIVNTLAELSRVDMVKFLVGGEELTTLKGHLDLTDPVEPDWGFVE